MDNAINVNKWKYVLIGNCKIGLSPLSILIYENTNNGLKLRINQRAKVKYDN